MENNINHFGWQLSRKCILDTMIAKRSGTLHEAPPMIKAFYTINTRALRETQLAPYQEKLRAGRYREKQLLKKMASDIVIVIREGIVDEVRANNPYTRIWIADYDNNGSDTSSCSLEGAEERGIAPDMHVIYGG